MKNKYTIPCHTMPCHAMPYHTNSFLCLLKHHMKFLPDLSALLGPLKALTHSCEEWTRDTTCEPTFKNSKRYITGKALCHCDHSKPLKLVCDASSYGRGAVIYHVSPDGVDKPIMVASFTVTSAERNY